jgi:thiamine pyrophosphokinase
MQFSNTALILGSTFEYHYQYENLIKNAAYIVVLDSTINKFIKYNYAIIPHTLLGDFDRNIDKDQIKTHFPNINIIHTPDQNKTDFEKAIEHILEKGYKKIIGLGLTGKRMDHTFNNISSLAKYNDEAQIQILDDYSIIECISRIYRKKMPKGTTISLLPLGDVQGIITKNLKYPLMNESLKLGIRTGSSNEVMNDGEVVVTIGKGKLVVMECWD